jgi:hypothetical protein
LPLTPSSITDVAANPSALIADVALPTANITSAMGALGSGLPGSPINIDLVGGLGMANKMAATAISNLQSKIPTSLPVSIVSSGPSDSSIVGPG